MNELRKNELWMNELRRDELCMNELRKNEFWMNESRKDELWMSEFGKGWHLRANLSNFLAFSLSSDWSKIEKNKSMTWKM